MKILIYGLNYAPELTGTGKYTAEMAESLVRNGHEVRVICAPPYYPQWQIAPGYSAGRYRREAVRGVRVWRAPIWIPKRPGGLARMLHLLSFALSSLPVLLCHAWWRPHVIMTIAPSLANAPAAWALARLTRAKSWLHIQDFEVDAAFELGLLRSPRAAAIARSIERTVLRRFDVVSSISDRMIRRAFDKGVDGARLFSLPNWVDTQQIFPLGRPSEYRRLLGIDESATVVLYSGNMGVKQGIEILAWAAAKLSSHTDIVFVFCGNGASKADLETRCTTLKNCRFLSLQPAERLNELLNLADIHVLPQRNDAADLVMPSKLTGMLASGRAIIAMARVGTELSNVVSSRGVVIAPEDVKALVAAIKSLAADPRHRAMLGAAARRFAQGKLSPASVLGRLDEKLGYLRDLLAREKQARSPSTAMRVRKTNMPNTPNMPGEMPVTVAEIKKIE